MRAVKGFLFLGLQNAKIVSSECHSGGSLSSLEIKFGEALKFFCSFVVYFMWLKIRDTSVSNYSKYFSV